MDRTRSFELRDASSILAGCTRVWRNGNRACLRNKILEVRVLLHGLEDKVGRFPHRFAKASGLH
jgi:hypothetical protein